MQLNTILALISAIMYLNNALEVSVKHKLDLDDSPPPVFKATNITWFSLWGAGKFWNDGSAPHFFLNPHHPTILPGNSGSHQTTAGTETPPALAVKETKPPIITVFPRTSVDINETTLLKVEANVVTVGSTMGSRELTSTNLLLPKETTVFINPTLMDTNKLHADAAAPTWTIRDETISSSPTPTTGSTNTKAEIPTTVSVTPTTTPTTTGSTTTSTTTTPATTPTTSTSTTTSTTTTPTTTPTTTKSTTTSTTTTTTRRAIQAIQAPQYYVHRDNWGDGCEKRRNPCKK